MYTQDISACFRDKVGGDLAPKQEDVLSHMPSLEKGLNRLKEHHDQGTLPHLTLPYLRKDLQELESLVCMIQDEFSDVVILGTGGSSLGAQALCALEVSPDVRLHFMDNVDPVTFSRLFAKICPSSTAFLVVSKSGATAETLSAFLVAIDLWRAHLSEEALSRQFFVITEDRNSPLRRIATTLGMQVIDHHPDLGGRYSVLSPVGLLPSMIAGMNAVQVREGAASALSVYFNQPIGDCAPAIGAGIQVAMPDCHASIMMIYGDKLSKFGFWYRQLWAESLGKDGKGTLPVEAMGAVDQHSQLQLYLAGPKDKFFTLMTSKKFSADYPIPETYLDDPDLDYFKGRTMGDLFRAEYQATVETLIKHQAPTRTLLIEKIDGYHLGGLFMHYIVETLLAAHLLHVNPFDQPAVEEGKILARDYLKAGL